MITRVLFLCRNVAVFTILAIGVQTRSNAFPQEISVGWSSMAGKISQKKETLVVGSGLGVEARYLGRISDDFGIGPSYVVYTGSQDVVLHGPSFLLQYSLLGQMPFKETEGALSYQLKQPLEVTLWAGPGLRFYDDKSTADSLQTLASKDAAQRTGSAWGTTAGIGVFLPLHADLRFTCLTGIFLGTLPAPEAGSALAVHLSLGVSWGI